MIQRPNIGRERSRRWHTWLYSFFWCSRGPSRRIACVDAALRVPTPQVVKKRVRGVYGPCLCKGCMLGHQRHSKAPSAVDLRSVRPRRRRVPFGICGTLDLHELECGRSRDRFHDGASEPTKTEPVYDGASSAMVESPSRINAAAYLGRPRQGRL